MTPGEPRDHEPAPMETPANTPAEPTENKAIERVEVLLGTLLRVGVVASMILIMLGLTVSLVRHPDYLTDPAMLARLTHPGAAFPHTPAAVVEELGQFRGRAIITLGLLVLIATPVIRVATSVVVYVVQKDWKYVVLTSLVLIILLVSGLLGKTG